MKYVYIVLIGALLIGCGSDGDGNKENPPSTSTKGNNTSTGTSAQGTNASGTPAKEKGSNTSGTSAQGTNASGTPAKEKGSNTSGTPTKGDIGPTTKYAEGDTVIILKNANKDTAKFYSSSMGDFAKEKGLTLRMKDLESESCVSLGFAYKETINDSGVSSKEFTKGEATCTEKTIVDDTRTGSFTALFLLRK